MKIKLVASIFSILSIVGLSSQRASAMDLNPLLENLVNQLGNRLINKVLPSSEITINSPLPSQPPGNNYPTDDNYSNPYSPSSIPNSYPSIPSSSPSMPMPFIYNPIIIVPQSPPVFNNYSNNQQR